ncbi:MAG: hypothetical protein Q7S47_00320 [bacterium]|nr:hypothetical protein [bacterium]
MVNYVPMLKKSYRIYPLISLAIAFGLPMLAIVVAFYTSPTTNSFLLWLLLFMTYPMIPLELSLMGCEFTKGRVCASPDMHLALIFAVFVGSIMTYLSLGYLVAALRENISLRQNGRDVELVIANRAKLVQAMLFFFFFAIATILLSTLPFQW